MWLLSGWMKKHDLPPQLSYTQYSHFSDTKWKLENILVFHFSGETKEK